MLTVLPEPVRLRLATALPFAAFGGAGIVAGGIVAAVAGPTGWRDGSWLAAFLVLVVGVGQLGLGAGQAVLAGAVPSRRRVWAEVATWNLGCLAVMLGTVLSVPALVSAGGVLMLLPLAWWGGAVRGSDTALRWAARSYVALIAILGLSIPIGLTLSWLRA